MGDFTTQDALLRFEDGVCHPRTALLNEDGEACDSYGEPLTPDGETEIKGWGELDGPAEVYRGAGTWRLLVPAARLSGEALQDEHLCGGHDDTHIPSCPLCVEITDRAERRLLVPRSG